MRNKQHRFATGRATPTSAPVARPVAVAMPMPELAALEADGWQMLFGPVSQCYFMRHAANKWSTNSYYSPGDAMAAAATLQAGAAATMETRAATVAGLAERMKDEG